MTTLEGEIQKVKKAMAIARHCGVCPGDELQQYLFAMQDFQFVRFNWERMAFGKVAFQNSINKVRAAAKKLGCESPI